MEVLQGERELGSCQDRKGPCPGPVLNALADGSEQPGGPATAEPKLPIP